MARHLQSRNAFEEIKHDWAPYVVESGPMSRGWHIVLTFRNGYSALITCHDEYSYGIEMAVMRDGVIVYDIPITDDVLGYLTPNMLNYNLHELQGLPKFAETTPKTLNMTTKLKNIPRKVLGNKMSKRELFQVIVIWVFVVACGIVGTLLSNAGLQR